MRHIILFGPPGCGKGTQAKILSKKLGFIHLSTGDIFRNHIKNKTSLGEKARYYINKGFLVPDIITNNMLNIEIKKTFNYKGIIYDGYPRTKYQIFSLEKFLKKSYLGDINLIFSFSIEKELLTNRLLKRGKTSLRDDDINIKIVQKRIEEFYKKTAFIWSGEKWKNILVKLNASFSIKDISIFIEKKYNKIVNNER
ncbi:nucleoside monophosphate kinase [Blattabacterium cuenoti]|uniref:nucleoside monophosphate kinase n=1 Tax=Blattabacterium cuenoti TaxID=1653831 RepID=UPI00163BD7DB|nr:nucleoside monophosphate kinase [Blattabacterium cuenoti]